MAIDHKLNSFADGDALAAALAAAVAERLAAACETHGKAVLAVSGGTTPSRFFKALSHKRLPWKNITVTLIDERFVPPTNERSNQKLVSELLLQNEAAAANFVGLYNDAPNVEDGARIASKALDRLGRPFDVSVLGMGNDGHTASFFPGGDHLAAAISPEQSALVLPMQAEGAGEPRLTLALPVIAGSRFVALHIEGATKKTVLDAAIAEGSALDMPIRAVLRYEPIELEIFWAP